MDGPAPVLQNRFNGVTVEPHALYGQLAIEGLDEPGAEALRYPPRAVVGGLHGDVDRLQPLPAKAHGRIVQAPGPQRHVLVRQRRGS
jgi:hypothetical protein